MKTNIIDSYRMLGLFELFQSPFFHLLLRLCKRFVNVKLYENFSVFKFIEGDKP